ncbi:tetratricopeptide repeat protein [Streptomyces sp. RKAG293]|uniref:tetratricopeptide repeat protein n=1 Tax=Streptomyces sp. RKAG293 TaxID=2893403 RepID=UPI0020337A46|nr:tetratricopeptide repeat protein [Streptomyces sp. RKAG293]MCM2420618.1 tetratricopeptide repeat protein [Streptomyces sp. RKAG293]
MTIPTLPKHVPTPGAPAFAQRLRALMTAGTPAVCPIHVGLGDPVPGSSSLATITHAIARHLVDGTADQLPVFNTAPPPALRILQAASWARLDAMTGDFDQMPADLAGDLWHCVGAVCASPGELTRAEGRAASDLLLRLGYPRRAGEVLGLLDADIHTHVFHPETVRAELAVLFRLHPGAQDILEERALQAAADESLPPRARLALANFVVVRNGKRGTQTLALHTAAWFGQQAMAQITGSGMDRHLAEHTLYRAIAYVPFLRKDGDQTMELLDRAALALEDACPSPDAGLQRLAWEDHAFPMFETLSKTLLAQGKTEQALASSERLTHLSPYDHRAWAVRAQALVAAGHLEDAAVAWEQTLPQGGLPVAAALFYLGWVHQQLGSPAEAAEHYRRSLAVDPTAPVVNEHLEAVTA